MSDPKMAATVLHNYMKMNLARTQYILRYDMRYYRKSQELYKIYDCLNF